jgi:potassium-dependent mechanosensitive channel
MMFSNLRTLRWVLALTISAWLAAGLGASTSSAQQPAPAAETPAAAAPAAPAPAPIAAQPVSLPSEVLEPITRLAKSIEGAEKAIQHLKELEEELSRLRNDVEAILNDSTQTAEGLRPQLSEIRSLIEKLGPAPGKDAPAEALAIASERQRLNALAAAIDGAVKSTELTWFRARQLIEKITTMRHQIFQRNLFERRQSPLLPALWRDVGTRMPNVMTRLAYNGTDWWSWGQRYVGELVLIGIAASALFTILHFGAWRRTRRMEPLGVVQPSFFERASRIAWVAPLRMLGGVAAAALVYMGLDALDLLYGSWEKPAWTAFKCALIVIATNALAVATLAPKEPAWRLVPLSDHSALCTTHFIQGIVTVYAVDSTLTEFGRSFFFPLTLTVAQAFLANMLMVGLLVVMLATRFEVRQTLEADGTAAKPQTAMSRLAPYWLKLPLLAVTVIIFVASALGYVSLGRFVSQQLVLTGLIFAISSLLYLAIRAVTRERASGVHTIGDFLGGTFGLDAPRQRQIARLFEATLTFALALIAIPAILLQWGFSGADIRDWGKSALFGFEIGQFRISLARILLGIGLFTLLLLATRLIQKWLRDSVMSQGKMDAGIANSVDTAIGYLGVALAALIAVSYAGFDITSLAIVAGALSVGIGFGLQSIVNNFVSGLILLIERPIKVGDWIVVGDQQGNVRRISVRSTEIETFDRASLILPNSELITGRVFNWTHRNLLGRVSLKIAVDPNADPDAVHKVLKQCAETHPSVLKSPPPSVSFDSFSGNSLDYTVRVTVADVNTGGTVTTDLRIAILRALRAAGLMVPNPQYEVVLRDSEPLKRQVAHILDHRKTEAAADADMVMAAKKPGAAAS